MTLPQLEALTDTSADICVICLEQLTFRAITPCNHWFDFLCIASWLEQNQTCPLCKHPVTEVQYDWRSPSDFLTYNVPKSSSPSSNPPQSSTSRDTNSPPYTNTNNSERAYWTFESRRCRNRQQPVRNRNPPNSQQKRRPDAFANPCAQDTALQRRREIYRRKLYSLHVGSNARSRYVDVSACSIARQPALQSRARAWMRRELRAFDFLGDGATSSNSGSKLNGNTEFLIEYFVSVLKTVDIKDSQGRTKDKVAEFLGEENARLFLHELESWLRSPFHRIEDWDRMVQYQEDV